MTNLTILNNQISTFENLYSLNDLHKASGSENKHRPTFFLQNQQTKDLVDEIDRCENSNIALKVIKGGNNQGTYACKELVIAYASWISPKFHLVVLRSFLEMYEQPQLEQKYINEEQAFNIQQAVKEAVTRTGLSFATVWARTKNKFHVTKYEKLTPQQYYQCLDYINSLKPQEPTALPNQLTIPGKGRWFVVVDDFGNVTHIKNLEGKSIISTDIYRKLRADARATADILYEIAHRMEVVDGQCSLEQFNTPILNIANFNL